MKLFSAADSILAKVAEYDAQIAADSSQLFNELSSKFDCK
jgi:hypothetical protein